MYLYRALKGKQLSHRVRPGCPPKAELEEQNRQFEVSMRRLLAEPEQMTAHPTRPDQLPQRVDAAHATLESACRPYPHWLKTLSDTLRRWRLGWNRTSRRNRAGLRQYYDRTHGGPPSGRGNASPPQAPASQRGCGSIPMD
jgi:hypothetical protein